MAAALLLAAASCALHGTPERPLVRSLKIEGTKKVSEGELKRRILTAESSRWKFWEAKPPFEPNAWQADLRRLPRVYESHGYYGAKVVSDSVTPAPRNIVDLWVKMHEGEATLVRTLEFAGLEDLPSEQTEGVLDGLPLHSGDLFVEDSWNKLKEAIRSRLRNRGYVLAAVDGEAQVHLEDHSADLHLQVTPGLRYRIGRLYVPSLPGARIPYARIISYAKGVVTPGTFYSDDALTNAQARVFQMGVFSAVKVTHGQPDPQTQTVPIIIDAREALFHTIRAGGGVGLDQTRNEIHLLAEYTDRNFLGGLRRLTTRATGGLAFLPNVVAVIAKRNGAQSIAPFASATAELEQPHFFAPELRAQGTLTLERGVEPAYRYFGGKAKVGVIYQPRPHFSIFPSYNLEAYHFDQQQASNLVGPASLAYGCRNPCVLSYLEQVAEWDRRDNKQEPRRGHYAALSLQEGGGPLGGTFAYFRTSGDVRGYISAGQFTVAGRTKLGTLLTGTGEESPIVSRFFSGGPAMRGFSGRRLSPMALANQSTAATPGPSGLFTVPIGGNGLAEGSIELRWHLHPDWVLATFYDLGAVTQTSFAPRNIWDNLYHAVGVGVRYRTLVGPIRLDLARRLNIGPPLPVEPALPPNFPVSSGCFGLFNSKNRNYAGSPDDACVFHLSIGEAF